MPPIRDIKTILEIFPNKYRMTICKWALSQLIMSIATIQLQLHKMLDSAINILDPGHMKALLTAAISE